MKTFFGHLRESLVQPWGASTTDAGIQAAYMTAALKAIDREAKFRALLQAVAPSDAQTITNIKSFDSFTSKVRRGKAPNEIHDVLRGAILCGDDDDINVTVNRLQAYARIVELDRKVTENDYGYAGACHVKIILQGMIVEIQIMTKKLWQYKEWSHTFYSDVREDADVDPGIVNIMKLRNAIGREE